MDGGIFCRTRNFTPDYHYTHQFIDTTFFDEMVCINVKNRLIEEDLSIFSQSLDDIVMESQLPISIGGGLRTIEDIEFFRTFGADRYLLNQTQGSSDIFIENAIKSFGKSSIISCINHWGPFTASREGISEVRVVDRINEIRENCGGDILLNSMERDGTLRGLDLDLVDDLARFDEISFILSGGLGNINHLCEALGRENVVGVCTSNVYHLTTNTISNWRKQMITRGLLVRQL